MEEARRVEIPQEETFQMEEKVAKRQKTERSASEMVREGGGEVSTSQSQSRHNKGYMMNICLTDSDEELNVERIMTRFMTKLTKSSRTRPGRIA